MKISPFDISTSRVLLERVVYNNQVAIDNHELQHFNSSNTSISSYLDHFVNRSFIRFRHQVYATKPQKETHVVKYPKTWWDAFKLEYKKFFSFLPAVLPVEYKTLTVEWEGRALFPELELLAGQYREVVVWKEPTLFAGDCL